MADDWDHSNEELDQLNYEASSEGDEDDVDNPNTNEEYLAFIRKTREHQREREKNKQEKLISQPELALEPYYTDVSQVNTLVADNAVEAPKRTDQSSQTQRRAQELINMYGGQEQYEKIRSIEMEVDGYFKRKCKELSPSYWPAMPINPKPYLNQR